MTLSRLAQVSPATYNEQARTVEAVFAAGVRRPWFGILEELAITPDAVDLSRVALGQVRFLDSHDQSSINAVLGTVETASIVRGQLVGRLRFADTEAGRNAEAMVARGEVNGISVGYQVSTWALIGVENDIEIWQAQRWALLEVSLVAVPADPAAVIRSAATPWATAQTQEQDDMHRNASGGTPAIGVPAAVAAAAAATPAPMPTLTLAQERQVRELVERAGLPDDFAARCVNERLTLDQAREQIFDELAARSRRTAINPSHSGGLTPAQGSPEFLARAIEDALYSRMTGTAPQGAAIEWRGRSALDMGAALLEVRGEQPLWRSRERLAQQILTRAGVYTTTDFPNLLSSAGNRVLLDAYKAAETPLKAIAARRDAPDFRTISALKLSEAPQLLKVPESGEVKAGSRAEAKESFKIETFARRFGLSRQAIINDDLAAFSDTNRAWGRAAAETEATQLVALLTANSGNGVNLDDGNPLYTTTRGNKAASGTVIDVTNLGAARKALRDMKGLDGVTPISVTPRHLVVGSAKETEAEQVLTQILANQVDEVNPFPGKLTLHVEPRLTGNAWRLFADPAELPVIAIAYLSGHDGPIMEVEQGWDYLGAEFRCILDFGAGILEHRGTYLNTGA